MSIKAKKLTFDKVEELYTVFTETLKKFDPRNDHEELLYAHVQAFQHKLKMMVVKGQVSYKLTLTETEAVFFRQVWQYVQMETTLYRAEIARNMMEVADRLLNSRKTGKMSF